MNFIQPGQTVLIADDDPMFCVMLQQFFEQMGYHVQQTEDGAQAVQYFEEHHPAMLILDGDMPNMDGFAACECIRSMEGGATVPIFIVTALTGDAAADCALAVQANSYISKPIQWQAFRDALSCVMEVQ